MSLEKKEIVKKTYTEVVTMEKSSCCGPTDCCSGSTVDVFHEDYTQLEGYNADADYGLGCGIPTDSIGLKEGETVVDLGSGAGNDLFVARAQVGETGRLIGVDFTPDMVKKAKENVEKLGYDNFEFVLGDIEDLPLEDNIADVIISNCVLNLVPDKNKAFDQIHRVLKPGGRFSISDIVVTGPLTDNIRNVAQLYAGCISGAIKEDDYLENIRQKGFKDIEVVKRKIYHMADELLNMHVSKEDIAEFRASGVDILSITVQAKK
ncbi:MAG: arsenite methyltransferase [Cyclobacteriaceae bacterium]|nr:arsenite methyltransferase [Cyclobacteriaceae bacterium]